MERCVSCDAPLVGPYCSQCGERTLEPDALTLRHFLVHTVASELLSVDGKLWRTLRLLFTRPGRLALEYAAGRRRPYLNPFRLLLIAIVVYLLMTASGFVVFWRLGPVTANMAPAVVQRGVSLLSDKEREGDQGTIDQIDRYGLLRRQVAAKEKQLASPAARDRFHDRLAAFVQPASFANVVLFAVTLYVAFRSQRHRFLEHVAFSMQFMSFVLLSSLAGLLVVGLHRRVDLGGFVFLLLFLIAVWQFAYLAVAIRRFYLAKVRLGGWLLSVAAALLLYVLNSAYMTAVQLAGAAIALALA